MSEFTSEIRELDIDQLDSVSGGVMTIDQAVMAAVRWVVHTLDGPGPVRRSTDRPN